MSNYLEKTKKQRTQEVVGVLRDMEKPTSFMGFPAFDDDGNDVFEGNDIYNQALKEAIEKIEEEG